MNISVIIPVFNEENTIGGLLSHLYSTASEPIHEILVIDSGSQDLTEDVVRTTEAEFILSPQKGRGPQMNYGASIATGEILYFLHADSRPPSGWDRRIRLAVSLQNIAGCFRMKFDHPHWMLKLFGWLTRFRFNICRGGDQSLFVKKEVFDEIGGYRGDFCIMEDMDIIPRLKEKGRFCVISADLVTSARRYDENGVVRLQFLFGVLHAMNILGYSQERMLHFYRKHIR